MYRKIFDSVGSGVELAFDTCARLALKGRRTPKKERTIKKKAYRIRKLMHCVYLGPNSCLLLPASKTPRSNVVSPQNPPPSLLWDIHDLDEGTFGVGMNFVRACILHIETYGRLTLVTLINIVRLR